MAPDPPEGVKLKIKLTGDGGPPGRVAWSPDGQILAVPSTNTIGLWAWQDCQRQRVLTGHRDTVYHAAFNSKGDLLASASADTTIKLWNPRIGKCLKTLKSKFEFNSVEFTPSGMAIATGSDAGAQIWGIDRPKVLFNLTRSLHVTAALNRQGTVLASPSASEVSLWNPTTGEHIRTVAIPDSSIPNTFGGAAFHPNGEILAVESGCSVYLLDVTGRPIATLEGHTFPVQSLAFSSDGRVLASRSENGTLRLWDAEGWVCLATITDLGASYWASGLAFHPSLPLLANASGRDVDIWELDYQRLFSEAHQKGIAYTTAKIVLVGDSGVGKTGLGYRLAHKVFKEHSSTHGQQFWQLPELGLTRSDGTHCEAILWDLAGQPDYRLVHALFLDDADLALVLFDPTRDDDPLQGVQYWLRQLGIQDRAGLRKVRAILVAARADRGAPRMASSDIEAFCGAYGIKHFLVTSAREGEGLAELAEQMRDLIDWDDRPATVTTQMFKSIKDFVLALKTDGQTDKLIISPDDLRQRLQAAGITGFTNAEMVTAIGHLSNHGYVSRLKTSDGKLQVLLSPELLNNLASSIVLEARRNPKGLGSLEEARLLAGEYRLPELDDLSTAERDVMLDSAVAMFLEHNVCFRETDPLSARVYLVFPELINMRRPDVEQAQPIEEGTAYTVSGAVENVYASLVVLLGYTSQFTRTNQWRDQARYVVGDGLVCGFRVEATREGEMDLVLYFGTAVGTTVRTLFQSLFESFLARRDLTIQRFDPLSCSNAHQLNRAVVREQMAEGTEHVFCSRCGEKMALPKMHAPIELTQQQTEVVVAQRRLADQRSRFEQALFRLSAYVTQEQIPQPECFISYACGDSTEEHWVEHNLATDLLKAGLKVILDRWNNARVGSSVPRFVERASTADRVIVVGTPAYRTKYENNKPMGGYVVAAEGDIIGHRLIGSEDEKRNVLPLLLAGEEETSLPPLLHGRVYADFRVEERYFKAVFDLILSIYEIEPRHPVANELVQTFLDQRR